jgi:hypothetical protein
MTVLAGLWNAIPDLSRPLLFVFLLVAGGMLIVIDRTLMRQARREWADIRAREKAARAWAARKGERP